MKGIKKIIGIMFAIVFIVSGIPQITNYEVKGVSGTKEIYPNFLKADGKQLKNENGKEVYLRGVNAGGYMLQEIWLCATHGSTDDNASGNIHCQQNILDKLNSRFGSEKAKKLIDAYENNYWTTKDFENCAKLGVNCIRLPIWYRNLVDENGNWYENAFDRIDWFVETAGRYGIYVIIDMHGTYGSQNGSHNSGTYGGSTNQQKKDNSKLFFGTDASTNQAKFLDMWSKIAQHYKDNPVVAGYDLINEPMADYMNETDVTGTREERLSKLWDVYDRAYKKIRTVDNNHIIIMEAVWDSDSLPDPADKSWTNVMYEYHQYNYDNRDDKDKQVEAMQNKISNISNNGYNVPSYIGEFNLMSNSASWSEGVKLLNENKLNWTVWNYKCTKQYGNWGLFNTPGNGETNDADTSKYWADVENDSYETILSKWSNQGSITRNSAVTDKIKNYFPGTVDNISDSKIRSVGMVEAEGMMNEIDVDWYPKAGMEEGTQYNIYIDDSQTVAATVSKSEIKSDSTVIKATDYTDYNGVVIDPPNGDPVNIGGIQNGAWVEYKNITLSRPVTSVTFNYSCQSDSGGIIYVYDGSMDNVPVGKINITPPKSDAKWSDYVTQTIDLSETLSKGNHTIYLKFVNDTLGQYVVNLKDFTLISTYGTAKLTNVVAGKHTVSVQAALKNEVSAGKSSDTVEVVSGSTILKSDKITIEGFQIKTNGARYYNTDGEVVFDEGKEKVAFRTICKAPTVGATITVSGKNYKVKSTGIIYTLDPNSTGVEDKDVLDSSYSILNTRSVSGKDYAYVGAQKYNNNQYTFGYITTANGVISEENGIMRYVRTITNNSYYGEDGTLNVITNSIHARGFVVTEDGTLIYGTDTATMSIPEVADYLYKNVLSSNYNGHAYLYNNILSKISASNPYYYDHTVDYGWNDNLYDPGKNN